MANLVKSDTMVRCQSAIALGHIAKDLEVVVPALIGLLEDRGADAHSCAVEALREIGPPAGSEAVVALRKYMSEAPTDFLRSRAAEALSCMSNE